MTGLVTRIIDSSFIDGPGHRAVVFLQGCDMRCLYCHNPETQAPCNDCGACVDSCPAGALSFSSERPGAAGAAEARGERPRVLWDKAKCVSCDACIAACPNRSTPKTFTATPEGLAGQLGALVPFIDGVTFSGGECTRQAAFLAASAAAIRALDQRLTVYADTNGGTDAAVFDRLLGALDGFIFDLKAFDEEKHLALTGKGRAAVLRNLEAAAAARKLVEVRSVLVHGWNDETEAVREAARRLLALGGDFPWRLIPYRPQGVRGPLATMPRFDRRRFEDLVAAAASVLGDRVVTPVLD